MVVQTGEKHYYKQNTNHHSVIYKMVTLVCGKVAIFTVSLASPPNGKVDGVLLRTVLHGRNPERFLKKQSVIYCTVQRVCSTVNHFTKE